jgi:hypothetical protein
MTKFQYASLDAMLFGLQLMSFEILWDAFPWFGMPFRGMQSIWIREEGDRLQLFVQTAESQDEKEWDDPDYLLREMFEEEEKVLDKLEPDSKHKIKHTIEHGSAVPKDGGYRELMSDRVFKEIAKKHAPWRLEEGR